MNNTNQYQEVRGDVSTVENRYSDWTIVVNDAESPPDFFGRYPAPRVFFVHGQILAQKSVYFQGLLQGPRFAESVTNVSTFNFPRAAVKCFHLLLDYLYNGINEGKLRAMQASDIANLLYLSDYFLLEYLAERIRLHMKLWAYEMQHAFYGLFTARAQNACSAVVKDRADMEMRPIFKESMETYCSFYQETRNESMEEFLIDWFCIFDRKDCLVESCREDLLNKMDFPFFTKMLQDERHKKVATGFWEQRLVSFLQQNTGKRTPAELLDLTTTTECLFRVFDYPRFCVAILLALQQCDNNARGMDSAKEDLERRCCKCLSRHLTPEELSRFDYPTQTCHLIDFLLERLNQDRDYIGKRIAAVQEAKYREFFEQWNGSN